MLKGISPLVSPHLLKALAEMGHGDEIVFSDAHFPAHFFVLTGETRKYGNVILKKGVTP